MTNEKNGTGTPDVLDLSDLSPQRQSVRLTKDGDLMEMVLPAELSIQQRADVMAYHRIGDKLNDKTTLDADDARRLQKALDKSVKIVLPDATEDDLAGLNDLQKEAVVLSFMTAFGKQMKHLASAAGGAEVTDALEAIQAR